MSEPLSSEKTVFSTPWFQVKERAVASGNPYYLIESSDFVVVLAITERQQIVLARQYRPGVDAVTLELPAGHIDPGETPEEAGRKELLEETGYEADEFVLLGRLSTSTARFTNRTWCFLAQAARPSARAEGVREPGLEAVVFSGTVPELVSHPDFCSATACGTLMLAAAKGYLRW